MTAQLFILTLSMKNLSVTVLVLIALGIFALVVLLGAIAAYFLACARSNRTSMKGTMVMGVSLNMPNQCEGLNQVGAEDTLLNGITFQIPMNDPENPPQEELRYLFSPARSGLERAYTWRYPMEVFLHRYRLSIQNVCGREEPFCVLLEDLERDGRFCAGLGRLYRTNGKKGVRILDNGSFEKPKTEPDRIMVYADIPESAGDKFFTATNCTAKTICFTMHYRDGSITE